SLEERRDVFVKGHVALGGRGGEFGGVKIADVPLFPAGLGLSQGVRDGQTNKDGAKRKGGFHGGFRHGVGILSAAAVVSSEVSTMAARWRWRIPPWAQSLVSRR